MRVEDLVRSQIGTNVRFIQHDRTRPDGRLSDDFNRALACVLSHAEHRLARTVEVFWVLDGEPQHFCLATANELIVVFSFRFVELSAAILMVGLNAHTAPEGPAPYATQICLAQLSEIALFDGNHDLSVNLFLRSLAGNESLVYQPTWEELQSPEGASLEHFVTLWFAGLAHELGHFWTRPSNEWLSYGTQLAGQILVDHNEDALDLIGDVENLQLTAPALKPIHIAEELKADTFAIEVLASASKEFMKTGPRQADSRLMATELGLSLVCIALAHRARKMLQFEVSRTEADFISFLVEPSIVNIRLRSAFEVIHRLWPDVAANKHVQTTLKSIVETAADTINKGVWTALDVVIDPRADILQLTEPGGSRYVPWEDRRNLFTLFSLAHKFSTTKSKTGESFQQLIARRFVSRAIDRNPNSSAIKLLAHVVKAPETIVKTYILLVQDDNGKLMAVTVQLPNNHGLFVLYFSTQKSLFAYINKRLKGTPNVNYGPLFVDCLEEDVASLAATARALLKDPDAAIEVAREGTSLFKTCMKHGLLVHQ